MSVHGRARADARDERMIRVLGAVARGYGPLSEWFGRRRTPSIPVDRALPVVVDEVRTEAVDVVSLRLSHVDGAALPAWQPGSHVDVLLPSGRRRQYSLCGDPLDVSSYRIATRLIHDGDGGSREIHGLTPGTRLVLGGPRNAFPLVRQGKHLFIAGGIGITPILPMVRDAVRRGADFQVLYTGRDAASLAFVGELRALAGERVTVRTDDVHGAPDASVVRGLVRPGDRVYCCGPPPMIDMVRAELAVSEPLHYERFSPPPVVDGSPFRVELARSGMTVEVGPDESALAAICRVRPEVGYSCRQGFCGTCRVRLVSGEVEHHDHCLTDEQRSGQLTPCVSRGVGTIAVDL